MTNITIMSRDEVSKLLRENNHNIPNGVRIISIRNSEQNRIHKDCDNILNLQFDDVLKGDRRCMTNEHAALVKEFAEKTALENADLIVQCHGGVSRSAGCAAAIIDGLSALGYKTNHNSGLDIWFNSKYVPNEHVYALVLSKFNIHKTDAEIEQLVKESAACWFENRKDL